MAPTRGALLLARALAALVALCVMSSAEEQSPEAAPYRGHVLLRVVPNPAVAQSETQEEDAQQRMRRFLDDHLDLDIWKEPSRVDHSLDVRVEPDRLQGVLRDIAALGLESRVIIPDVQGVISEQEREVLEMKRANPSFGWETYYELEEINQWLRSLEGAYPNVVSVVEGGKTFEGRTIFGVKLKFAEGKPIAFLEAGIHAREWITPATATFLINEILTNTTGQFRKVVESYEWHIFPNFNPDGYEHTFRANRLWRKTRSKSVAFCRGVDPNRNWPFHWGEHTNTFFPCSETFPGFSAESEVETRSMRGYLDNLSPKPTLYISLHSYTQLLMFPWGYSSEHVSSYSRLKEISGKAVAAVRARYGTEYRHGSIAETIYVATGNTIDYAFSKGINYSFVFELRDQGQYGFLLPPDQIRNTAEETIEGIYVIAEEAMRDM